MKTPNDIQPPKWPLRVLRFLVKKEFLEEIEGDMEEQFYDNVERFTLRKARRMYWWEMVRLMRPILIRNFESVQRINPFPMFKNYFSISTRSLMKNPLNSFINIFGLSMGIGFCMLTFAFATWTFGTDQFHEHKNEVFLVTFFADRDGSEQEFGRTPRPLGEMLRQDFAHVKKVCRVEDRNVVVKHEDDVFHERVRFVDSEFLEMFTFPLKWGVSGSLADLNSILLSEEMSEKYFGEENPIGSNILIKLDDQHSKVFKVTGVAREFPKALTIRFGFLINFENFKTLEPAYDFHDWNQFVNATFIQVDDTTQLSSIAQGTEKYRVVQNAAVQKEWAIKSFGFASLATLNVRSETIRDDISRSSGDNTKSVMFLTVIGAFMLALACFNYINIAIVSAAKRLKEIGVRKSIGASRKGIIVQFLSENVVVTFLALVLGFILGITFFIPWFEHMNDFSMGFTLNNPNLWIYLPLILLVTGIASGIYPAFYISRFQVTSILKGSLKFGRKNPITQILLGFQLIMACILITCGVLFTWNSDYLAHRSWGYNPRQAMYANVPDQLAFEQLTAVMSRQPDVVTIAGSVNHLGRNQASAILHMPEREYEVDRLSVDAKYFETLGLQTVAGRTFNDHDRADRQSVVVNELLVKNMAWEQPVGQQFEIDSIRYEVIGVVKDFHSYNFFNAVKPAIFTTADKADVRYLTVRVQPGSEIENYRLLQSEWAKLFPETPFQGGLQEDVWGDYFLDIGVHGKVWQVVAFIATMLACMGLYGLVTLNVTGRAREFSIRKVLGAGFKNITGSITKQYLLLFSAALLVGAPVSYFLTLALFDMAYKYHMPITYAGVTLATVILITVLLLTISTQIKKVMSTNAVEGLKQE